MTLVERAPRIHSIEERRSSIANPSLVPRPSARGGGGRPGTHCIRMRVIYAEITYYKSGSVQINVISKWLNIGLVLSRLGLDWYGYF